MGSQTDRQRDLLAFLHRTPCFGVLANDRTGRIGRIIFLCFLQFQQCVVLRRTVFIQRLAHKVYNGNVLPVGEQQVAGVRKDQVDQNGCTDHKSHRHAEEDRQKGERLLLVALFLAGFAPSRIGRSHTTCLAGADVASFATCFRIGDNTVDALFGIILHISVLVFEAHRRVTLKFLNGVQHFLRALIPLGRIFLHSLFGDLAKTFRHVGGNLCQGFCLIGDLHDGNGYRTVPVKRQPAGEHLIQHYAHRIDVGTSIGLVAFRLFGADIVHRANGFVADRLALRTRKTSNTEVHHFDGSICQQHDVLGLNISVDNALGMGMLQSAQYLRGKVHGFFPGQGAATLLKIFLQRDTVHIFHHDILQTVGNRYIVYLDDIGMIQNGNRLRLVFEAANQFLVIQKFFFQYLHRDGISGLFIDTAVHIGHAADTDQTLNQIPAIQSFPNQIIHC